VWKLRDFLQVMIVAVRYTRTINVSCRQRGAWQSSRSTLSVVTQRLKLPKR